MITFLDYDDYEKFYIVEILNKNINFSKEWWFSYIDENGEMINFCKILNINEYIKRKFVLELFSDYRYNVYVNYKIKIYICCDDEEVRTIIMKDYKGMCKENNKERKR